MIIHGSRSVLWFQVCFMVFQDSMLVLYSSRSIFMVFQGSTSILSVPGRFFMFFSRFQVGFSWFQVGFPGFSRFQFDLYLGPTFPLGLASRRPALA